MIVNIFSILLKSLLNGRAHAIGLFCLLLVPGMLMLGAVSFAQSSPTKELGIWFDDTGKGAVELTRCGTSLCGRIIWLKDPLNGEGKPLVDRFNPNPSQRAAPICGLQILGGLQAMPEGTWDIGWIYDPKTGKAYDAAVTLVSADQLKVTGYKGVKIFSRSFIWTRAPSNLPRCKVDYAASDEPSAQLSSSDTQGKSNK